MAKSSKEAEDRRRRAMLLDDDEFESAMASAAVRVVGGSKRGHTSASTRLVAARKRGRPAPSPRRRRGEEDVDENIDVDDGDAGGGESGGGSVGGSGGGEGIDYGDDDDDVLSAARTAHYEASLAKSRANALAASAAKAVAAPPSSKSLLMPKRHSPLLRCLSSSSEESVSIAPIMGGAAVLLPDGRILLPDGRLVLTDGSIHEAGSQSALGFQSAVVTSGGEVTSDTATDEDALAAAAAYDARERAWAVAAAATNEPLRGSVHGSDFDFFAAWTPAVPDFDVDNTECMVSVGGCDAAVKSDEPEAYEPSVGPPHEPLSSEPRGEAYEPTRTGATPPAAPPPPPTPEPTAPPLSLSLAPEALTALLVTLYPRWRCRVCGERSITQIALSKHVAMHRAAAPVGAAFELLKAVFASNSDATAAAAPRAWYNERVAYDL